MVYEVATFKERLFSSTLNPEKLAGELNTRAGQGWRLSRTITAERRVWLIFKARTHYLIFERSGTVAADVA
jgi:hypothetical protein